MISAANLTVRFGRVRAVDGLSFDLPAGQCLALCGPNGAGKTTIIRSVLGLVRFRGRLTIAGLDTRRRGKAARSAIGYVPQELNFYDDFRSIDALRFFARIRRAAPDRPETVLAQVGLADAARKRVGELSGGMKQRLALALALLSDPPVLVLDEMTSNLDAAARASFLRLLAGLKDSGKTILFSSHRVEEVDALADRVLLLERGRLIRDCTAAEFAPAQPPIRLSVPDPEDAAPRREVCNV
jgi:ABC-type multidrug transport system ATPase subunit